MNCQDVLFADDGFDGDDLKLEELEDELKNLIIC